MASPTSLASTATTITTTAARLIAATPATVTRASPLFNVIFFLGPLLSLVFAVLAVSRRPRPNRIPSGHRSGNSPTTRRQAHIAYAYFALLALLSTLAGALPFIQADTSTASKAEAVVQGLLSFSLGLPALHLPTYYDSHSDNGDDSNSVPSTLSTRRIFETLYSSILVITLTGATLTALLQQLLPSSSAAGPIEQGHPLYLLPHALYLLYTLLALRRIACVLFRLLYPASPSFFSSSCFSSFLHSASSSSSRIRRGLARSTSRRPITIHISTQRTSVPFSESTSSSSPTSPSSAISFPCPIAETEQQPGGAIELALPKRKHKDTRSRLIDTANRSVLYQDKDKRSAGCLGSDSNLIAINKHRHRYRQKKSSSTSTSSSIDSTSTTSTVTAFDQQQGRDFVANTPTSTTVTPGLRCSTPPLSSYPFIAPPRAAHTATSGTSLDTASIPLLAPARISSSHKRVYSLPLPIIDNNVSTSTDSTEESPGIPSSISSIVSVGDQPDLHLEHWGESCNRNVSSRISSSSRLAYSHTTRKLLVTLAAVQVVLIVGYACGLGENISPSGASHSPLRIIQTLCIAFAVIGTMAAYLLHAYNTHISPSRSRSAAKSKSKSKSDPTSASTPLVTYSTQHTSHHYNYNHSSTTTTNGVGITTTSSASVIQIAETNPRPVLIQLAPPPPPRTRRKRVDAFAAGPVPGTSMPIRERSRMDVPRSVSISMSGTTTTSRFGDPSVRYSSEGDRIGLGDALDGLDAYSYSNPNSYTYQHQQHPGYDETTFNDVQNSAAAYNARRISQPITLTYEPPVMSGGLSMLETTETEGEAHEDEEDEDFEDVMEEDDMAGHEDGGIRVGMYMEDLKGDLALEDEMQKALSRSSSMATSMSGLSTGRRRGHARTHSMTKHHVAATGGTSGTKAAPNKPKPSSKSKPKSKSSKAKKAAAEDPGMYIRKRGSMPIPPSATKRLFGFEFGWEHHAQGSANSLGATVGRRGRRQSAGVVKKGGDVGEKGVERGQESSFMDLQGTGIGANASTAVAVAVGVTTRKLKRHSTPAGSVYARSVIGGGVTRKQEKWEEVFGIGTPQAPSVVAPTVVKMEKENGVIAAGMKKLKKKRSQSVTRPDHADDVNPSARAGNLPDLPVAKTSNPRFSTLPNGMSSTSNLKIPASPSGPSTCDSGYGDRRSSRHANRASLGSGSSIRRGLQLKRSFKLSVGRTLGPGLTLASAGVGGGQEWEEHRRKAERERGDAERRESQSDETIPTDEDADVDVDGEIRSIAAARLVSASIARATPAATIVTAPSSAGLSTPSPPPSAYQPKPRSSPIDIAYPTLNSMQQGAGVARPVLPAIVTSPITIPIPAPSAIPFPLSAPASRRQGNGSFPDAQSPSRQQPHTSASTWMPHPFADAIEQPMPNVSSSKSYMTSASDSRSGASVDDDVVQLEREMEEIRGRRGNGANAMDSPTTQLREFAEMAAAQAGDSMSICAPTPSPGLSSSMTPSVTSMFALAHAQAQNAAPAPPTQTQPTDKEKEKAKMKLFGVGHFQKRLALSSPPVSKSDWGPQSSGAGNTGSSGGFLYRFPMIFPNTFAGSPPDSRPAVNGGGNTQTNHPVPRPSTPRGGSTLRLSAMETVRSTFAIVGARMSNATSRMSVTSSTGASLRNGGGHGFGEMVLEDIDGDFMDLRDPFASPPPASNIATVAIPSSLQGRKHSGKVPRGDGDVDRNVLEEADALKRKMSTWGRLPMPASTSAAGNGSSTVSGTAHKRHSFVNGRPVVRVVGKPSSGHHRKHKKEKRSRKVTLPSMSSAMGPMKVGSPEDADFGLEEALLSQRLLNRLDSGDWESRV